MLQWWWESKSPPHCDGKLLPLVGCCRSLPGCFSCYHLRTPTLPHQRACSSRPLEAQFHDWSLGEEGYTLINTMHENTVFTAPGTMPKSHNALPRQSCRKDPNNQFSYWAHQPKFWAGTRFHSPYFLKTNGSVSKVCSAFGKPAEAARGSQLAALYGSDYLSTGGQKYALWHLLPLHLTALGFSYP